MNFFFTIQSGRWTGSKRSFFLAGGVLSGVVSALCIVLLFHLTGLSIANASGPELILTDVGTGKLVYERVLPHGEPFSIRFIHSIHRTPIIETYHIDASGQIILDAVAYQSLGVGNPSTLEDGQTFRLDQGYMIIEQMNRRLGEFVLATGQVVADHHLLFEGDDIPLTELCPPGTRLSFAARMP
jgi:hypothetical protein